MPSSWDINKQVGLLSIHAKKSQEMNKESNKPFYLKAFLGKEVNEFSNWLILIEKQRIN